MNGKKEMIKMDLKGGDSILQKDMVYIINPAAKCAGKSCEGGGISSSASH